MGLRAGLLNRRIQIQRRVERVDDAGQVHQDWVPQADVWARAEPLGGREGFGQEQFVATGDVRFTIRRRADVNALCRIVYTGTTYDVMTVAEDVALAALLIVGKARTDARAP